MLKENKGIVISGILLVLFSAVFTVIINFNYNGNLSEITGYFIRTIFRLGISVGAFALCCKYGRGPVLKFGWVLVPTGIILSALADAQGCIDIYGYSIEIASLTNTLALLGLAAYFYKCCLKSVIHTIIFWISGFLFLITAERRYLTLVLFVMIGLILLSARKNKLIGKKSIRILNFVLYVALTLSATRAITTGIIGADVANYKPLWAFGIVAGVIVFIVLSAFVFFVCKKCFKNVLTDTTPIACATASILLVRYVVSMLNGFGIALDGLFASIPVISDGICGYISIFALLGLIAGKEKVDIHSKRFGFVGRLSNFTKREFVFDGVECRSIEGVLQSFKCKDANEQKHICSLFGIEAKQAGAELDWKTEQVLYWKGNAYKRDSVEYEELLKRLYKSVWECDISFKKDIEASKGYILEHSIGVNDKRETVLTKSEFILNLTALIENKKTIEH